LLFMFGRDILNISEYSNILCNTYCCWLLRARNSLILCLARSLASAALYTIQYL
jgi:hypothetical protein